MDTTGALLGPLAAFALLLVPVGGLPLLCAALLLHGVLYAATDGVLMALAASALPLRQQASGMAVLQTGQALGRLLAAVAFGAAWTLWGSTPALALAAAGLAVVLGLAALLLRDTREGHAPRATPVHTEED